MKKAVIYARISRTDDKHNTDRQLYDLNNYAKANSIEIVRTYTEKVTGAKKRSERPVLNECLIYCVSHKIDILLLNALDRLGRDTDDILTNIMFCKDSGLNVYFQKEQFSIFTPDGKPHPFLMIFIAVLGTIAEMERENIKFRLQSGLNKYIAEGGKLGRPEGTRKTPADYERDYPQVIKELRRKDRESYDRIAKLTGTSKNTVITVARLLGLTHDQQQPTVIIHTPDPSDEKIEE